MATLVTIATYHSQPKAEAARILLAHEGIEAVLLNETIVAMDWLLMNAIGGIKLQVATEDAARAASLIAAYDAEQKERQRARATELIRFKCSECGAAQQFSGDRRGGVESCTKCGRYIDVPGDSDDQMLADYLTVDAGGDAAVAAPESLPRKISLRVEIACVLAFVYLPLLMDAMFEWSYKADWESMAGYEVQLPLIRNMLHVVPPLLLIIALGNEPWSKFGIVRPRWIADSFIAFGVWFLSTFAMSLTFLFIAPMTQELVQSERAIEGLVAVQDGLAQADAVSWGMVLWVFVALLANSVAEELAMRGYLIPRFEELFKSPVVAIGLSGAIFASYHIYQGVENTIAIFMFAIVYGVFFGIFRRLWPLIVAHTVSNMVLYLNV